MTKSVFFAKSVRNPIFTLFYFRIKVKLKAGKRKTSYNLEHFEMKIVKKGYWNLKNCIFFQTKFKTHVKAKVYLKFI